MLKTAGFVALAYVLIVAVMYTMQRRLQYFPDTAPVHVAQAGLSDVQQITLETPDRERLIAWYLPPQTDQPVILFFHGNAGSIAGRADRLQHYAGQGHGALFVSYRGYGGSTGEPTERGLITDALTAYDWLEKSGINPARIAVVGESLGSGVAVQLAAQRKVAGLVLEAPFSSATNVAAQAYWWLPVRWLMKDTFDSAAYISRIDAPLLIIHGTADEVVPYASGRRLFETARQPKTFLDVEGGGHAGILTGSTWQAGVDFIQAAMKR